ncbi:MAG: hypothetical protein E7434_04795 [Ruminococcaceae bacterium]|nr:hypothetical protein [Oscillospiraceae bacterium]
MTEQSNIGATLLIGGNLICNTMYARGLLSAIEVTSILAGNSPFSLACNTATGQEYALDAIGVDRGNCLEKYLQTHRAEYLVLDLHYVCQPLFTDGENYYTKMPDAPQIGKPVSINDLSREQKKKLIECYADLLLKYFPGKNIALIKTVKTEFIAVKNRVRAQENEKFNQFIEECENWFLKRTGCMYIETLKFYFMEKKSTGTQYEGEAYLDLADNVRRFVRQQHVRRRPIFRYSLDRYCRYYDNIYKRAFGAFLRTDNAVENLVYSSEPWFVKENYELLRAADKLLKSGYKDLASALDMSMKNADMLKALLLAMDAVLNKDYVNPEIRYDLLFEQRITVRALWQAVRKYAAEHWKRPFPEQITEVNYGYYFSLMQLQMTTDKTICAQALKTIQALGTDETVELLPTAVDIWGSCVSRLAFQYDNVAHLCKMVFRGNLFQALPLFLDAPPVHYNKLHFMPPITADNKVVQYQLDSTLRAQLDKTESDWVVIDLYTLTALSIFKLHEKIYCDNQNFCSKKFGASKVTLHKEFTDEQIFAELDRFAAYLRKRYGDKIILIKHKRMEHYLDFEGKLKRFGQKEYNDSTERNPYNDRYTNHFAKKCGCYYIDIVDQFLSDEMNLLYLNTVHYENEFYTEVCKIMRHIISEQPNQRHFTTYDSLTKIRRIAKLNAKNPGSPVIKRLFPNGWLDELLFKLPAKTVSDHAADLARLYDERCPSFASAQRLLAAQGNAKLLDVLSEGAKT